MKIQTVYKYKPFNLFALDILLHNELYLADPLELNDPSDCATLLNGQSHVLSTTICSLSKIKHDYAMWSQYADGHRGLCFEFDYNNIRQAIQNENSIMGGFPILLDDVRYLTHKAYQTVARDNITETCFGQHVSYTANYEVLSLIKFSRFRNEREMRIVARHLNRKKSLKVTDLVTAVYLGLSISNKDASTVRLLIKLLNSTRNTKIKLYEAIDIDHKRRVKFKTSN
jgi:hypothetical protein